MVIFIVCVCKEDNTRSFEVISSQILDFSVLSQIYDTPLCHACSRHKSVTLVHMVAIKIVTDV